MNENRGSWYLLTGLIIGVILGLVYGWVFHPAASTDTEPASLRTEYKDAYRVMIAQAYQANNDLVRAKARLELLQDEDVYLLMEQQAQRLQAEGNLPGAARALAKLAADLRQEQ